MIMAIKILQDALLVTALCIDAFVASFSYGVNKIKIPFISALIISAVCSLLLALAIFVGVVARSFIPAQLAFGICFVILLVLGIVRLCDSILKNIIRKSKIQKNIRFKFLNLRFILQIYADPEEADFNASRVLNPGEAVYLALALSLDGLTVGFGAGLVSSFPIFIVLFSLAINLAAVKFGCGLGSKVAEMLKLDLSWLSGAILIGLAFAKLF